MYICEMNTALISIGSNENRDENIPLCRKLLDDIFESIHYSNTSITKPFGEHYKNSFLNQLALVETEMSRENVNICLKMLEKQIGRNFTDKSTGLIKIDIDLIKWNSTILKEEDWTRSYVADLLPSLYNDTTLI